MTAAKTTTFETDRIRVQVLGPWLVRVEERGAGGFEDRPTFTVRDRSGEPADVECRRENGSTVLAAPHWRVVVPAGSECAADVRIESAAGELLCTLSNAMRRPADLPEPSALPSVWVLGDWPRAVPPPWGALPPPADSAHPDSGWELDGNVSDLYVFFPAAAGYETFRRDFLRLTGPVPRVPLYTLGLWYSRYHPYDAETALAVIDRFRAEGIPLDVFVLDTDWRVGASCGYAVNETLFPDLAGFIGRAHEKHVRVMLNDHPEPVGTHALDPAELRFRRDGLTALLEQGVDLWWFDRNWHTHLQAPAPGLEKEVWGMCLYHDISKQHAPERRTLLLSNVDGIDNGWRSWPSHPAAHRYPVWWTGDTCAEWRYLRAGVINGVECGIRSMLPYVHEDLGGHHGQPDAELFVRYLQYGALCPVARLHCATQVHRYPWEYGPDVARITGDFLRLRYRLLPMLYAAAAEAHRSGTPLLRRCDLEWPGHPESADNTQYLLGDDLLVAPIFAPAPPGGEAGRTAWIPPGDWQDLWTGGILRGPARTGRTCTLREAPVWIRRGGLIASSPLRESSGTAVWPDLTVDAFLPLGDDSQARTLAEDDGISALPEGSCSAETALELTRSGSEAVLRIVPGEMGGGERPETRRLVLRLHLPPAAAVGFVRLNGTDLLPEEYEILKPAPDADTHLLSGAGAPPPPAAGGIIEWRGERDPQIPLELAVTELH